MHARLPRSTVFLVSAALAACSSGEDAATDTGAPAPAAASNAAAGTAPGTATPAGETSGFKTPESVKYDPELDVYFVANINGSPGDKDNNGFIARVRPDSTTVVTMLVEGGRNGATLNAPKGMAIVGDTLWVADIDAVRGFNKRTGAPVATIDLAAQKVAFLNDVAAGTDGIYVTDTNVRFNPDGSMSSPGRDAIYRITGRTVSQVAQGDRLGKPNGITWDARNSRFVVVPFGAKRIMTWKIGDPDPQPLGGEGPGQFDGAEVLGDGRIAVSSWTDSSVYVVGIDGAFTKIASGLNAPADIGYDSKRNLLLVPLFNDGVVRYFRVPEL